MMTAKKIYGYVSAHRQEWVNPFCWTPINAQRMVADSHGRGLEFDMMVSEAMTAAGLLGWSWPAELAEDAVPLSAGVFNGKQLLTMFLFSNGTSFFLVSPIQLPEMKSDGWEELRVVMGAEVH